jgi:4-hydroxy-tetrahydrodipicolinate synthase
LAATVEALVEIHHHEVAMFRGSIPALITPFRGDQVDAAAFQTFVAWQIEQGSHALFPCGTTGESPTLSYEEHKHVLELCIEVAKGRVPVLAGTGSNSTREAIALAQHAEKAGADAQVVVTPYYNKPNQEGLYRHFKSIHDSCGLPIIIYNIPSRCVIDMSVETMARLAELPRIVGVKDSTNDLTRPLRTKLAIGPRFCMLSGEDGTAVAFLAQGGHGCISVTANIAPKLCAEMHDAWERGDLGAVQSINERLMPLHVALFLETNPAPVKYAASVLGICTSDVRLPLCEIQEVTKAHVREAMARLELNGTAVRSAA